VRVQRLHRILRASISCIGALTLCASCSAASSPCAIPGFVLTIETTKCRLGSNVRHTVSDGDDVWYGDDGRFYVDLANQMAVCTAAWSSVTGPSVSAEIADVEEYFIGLLSV
jgi:hypothetical protein